MSNSITRSYSFANGGAADGGQVDYEIQQIVNTINNADAGTTAWTTIKAGSGTFTGAVAMGSNKITGLANGTVSTDAAAYGQIPTVTNPASYTPTITSFGTTSNINFWWFQIGKMIYMWGAFKTGTLAAATASITIPGTKTIDTSLTVNGSPLGWGTNMNAVGTPFGVSNGFILFSDASSTSTLYFSSTNTAGSLYPKDNADHISNSTTYQFVSAWVPVTA